MSLRDVATLYRALNCPDVNRSRFSGELVASPENQHLLNLLRNTDCGRLLSVECDGKSWLENKVELIETSIIVISFRLGNSSAGRFYTNFSGLLSSSSMKQGKLPDTFFITEENLFYLKDSNESDNSPYFDQLKKIEILINSLSDLAHYHDSKITNDQNKLVFLSNDEEHSHPVVLEIDLSNDLLNANLDDLTLLTSLLSSNAMFDAHFQPRKNILYSSLHEFVKGLEPKAAFRKLTLKWNDFAEVFQNNLGTYLSGFAFHKAKKEIAEAEIKFAEQLAKVTSDLIGKLFSIPVSIVAVIAMFHKDSTVFTNVLVVIGLLVAAVLLVGIVVNQRGQLTSVKHAKSLIDKSIQGNKDSYPEDLKKDVDDMSKRLNRNIRTANRWLWTFRFLAWLPVMIGTTIFYFMYN